jgi:hypothetical protein
VVRVKLDVNLVFKLTINLKLDPESRLAAA